MTFLLRTLLFFVIYQIGFVVGRMYERRQLREPRQLPKQPLEKLLDAGKDGA